MKISNFKNFKLDDIIGAGCGVVLVLILVLNAVIGARYRPSERRRCARRCRNSHRLRPRPQ